ncbi:hypothetical protein [Chryseobacterium daeguense]|uniref:hypothetical protein n=1 Tax=Chryseobacterium daeguense TaxID=412438 RepID=UPI000411790B|nr:hypothetical protein [Chryseobacterium daeguense]
MKKTLSAAIILAATTLGYSQVGINTTTPGSTLDITAKNSTGTTKNVDGLLVPRVDRERAQSMASIPVSTLIYVNSIAKGTQTGNAVNIDAVGYYYFDGSVWVKLNAGSGSATSVNIYNSDGTLTGNRTVSQGDKTLTFNGTSVNAFSVDGKTLSVDAANDRVGIGTNAPENKAHIVTTTPTSNRYTLIDAPAGASEAVNLALRNTSPLAKGNLSLLGFNNSGPTGGGAAWGIGSIRTGNTLTTGGEEEFYIGNSTGASYTERFRITTGGNVGVNTSTPTNTFDVNGTARVRTINQISQGTLITPVYVDSNGVLVKANPSNINQIVTNSVKVSPGATGTLVSGLPIGAMYRVAVTIYDGCTNAGMAEYYVAMSATGLKSVNSIGGMLVNSGSSPNFSRVSENTIQTTWPNYALCQGGSTTNFNYTIIVGGGDISIKNDGTITNQYNVVVTRMDPI